MWNDRKCESNEKVITSAFSGYLKSVFTEDNGCPRKFSMSVPEMPDIEISEQGILNLLLNLNVKSSPGPDGVPNAFLKQNSALGYFMLYTWGNWKRVSYRTTGELPESSPFINLEIKILLQINFRHPLPQQLSKF